MTVIAWRNASFQKAKYAPLISYPSFGGTASLSLSPPLLVNTNTVYPPQRVTGGAQPTGHPVIGGGGMGGYGRFGEGGFHR